VKIRRMCNRFLRKAVQSVGGSEPARMRLGGGLLPAEAGAWQGACAGAALSGPSLVEDPLADVARAAAVR
jgi:hypothetical protein